MSLNLLVSSDICNPLLSHDCTGTLWQIKENFDSIIRINKQCFKCPGNCVNVSRDIYTFSIQGTYLLFSIPQSGIRSSLFQLLRSDCFWNGGTNPFNREHYHFSSIWNRLIIRVSIVSFTNKVCAFCYSIVLVALYRLARNVRRESWSPAPGLKKMKLIFKFYVKN